jgi:GNAT superfamily N-acetyltransferase
MTVQPVVTLRQATANDAPKIAEIWHLGWRDGHLGFVPQDLVAARHKDSFRIRAAQRVSDTTVAVIDGQVAGFVMVVGDEVEQVYVAAPHRGTGVADMLMAEAERRVGRNGHATAWLAVVAGNARARSSTNAVAGLTQARSTTPQRVRTVQSQCLLGDM